MRGDRRAVADADLDIDFVLQYLKAMERHDILQSSQKFRNESTDEKFKYDLALKFIVKNISLLMLLMLLTHSLILLSETP